MGHRGTRGGKRGSEFNKSVKLEARRMTDTGSTSGVVLNGKRGYTPALNIHFENEESTLYADEGLIPRKSLSHKQLLGVLPMRFETETVNGKQINQLGLTKIPVRDSKGKIIGTTFVDSTGKQMTYEELTQRLMTVTSERVTWKSDKTLLKRGKVDQMPEGFKRVTSRSKRQEWIEEPKAPEGSLSWSNGADSFHDPILDELRIEPSKT